MSRQSKMSRIIETERLKIFWDRVGQPGSPPRTRYHKTGNIPHHETIVYRVVEN